MKGFIVLAVVSLACFILIADAQPSSPAEGQGQAGVSGNGNQNNNGNNNPKTGKKEKKPRDLTQSQRDKLAAKTHKKKIPMDEANRAAHKMLQEMEAVPHSVPSRRRRNAVLPDRLWDNGVIPYVIKPGFSTVGLAKIKWAMDTIFNITTECVRWQQRSTEPYYVTIIPGPSGSGCYSYVGQGVISLNLEPGCVEHSTILHEMLHSIGIDHEQSRSDRDNSIIVHYDNIQANRAYNYDKIPGHNLLAAYDTNSIMHYQSGGFAIDRSKPTMTAKFGGSLGALTDMLSELDMIKLNRLYKCPSECMEETVSYDGETCQFNADWCGISLSEFLTLNPELPLSQNCDNLKADLRLCCSRYGDGGY